MAVTVEHVSSKFHCEFSRHDHHNLELKFTLDSSLSEIEGTTDLYFFVPPAVKARSWSKTELMSDFYSRMRMSLPSVLEGGNDLRRAGELFDRDLAKYRSLLDSPGASSEPLLAIADKDLRGATQRLGALVGESLKRKKTVHYRELESGREAPGALTREVEAVADMVRWVQQKREAIPFGLVPYVDLLSEYVNHLYEQYLGTLQAAVQEFSDEQPGWEPLESTLHRLILEMTALRASRNDACDQRNSDRKRELQLVRFSQLKKFFQSNMFIEVCKQQVISKFSEPVAAAAAGTAAVWAAFAQFLERSERGSGGAQGIAILCFGVACYVLKDRLKDRGKHFLTRKVAKFLPDQVMELVTEDQSIGKIEEWFSVKTREQIPQSIRDERVNHRITEAESHLKEDILHFRQRFTIRGNLEGRWAIQECLRLNLERYLKFMDDPYKDMLSLEADGRFARHQAHRVYHFHALLKTVLAGTTDCPKQDFLSVVRVIVDKNGVHRVDVLDSRH